MAYIAVDLDGTEWVFERKPIRFNKNGLDTGWDVELIDLFNAGVK